MAKTLDFNTLKRPSLRLVMQDEAKTTIDVSTPTEGMVEELTTAMPELDAVLQSGDASMVQAIYDLAARLISCNRNFMKITAEELRDKYKLNLEDLVIFYSAYLDFIDEVTNSKN